MLSAVEGTHKYEYLPLEVEDAVNATDLAIKGGQVEFGMNISFILKSDWQKLHYSTDQKT